MSHNFLISANVASSLRRRKNDGANRWIQKMVPCTKAAAIMSTAPHSSMVLIPSYRLESPGPNPFPLTPGLK